MRGRRGDRAPSRPLPRPTSPAPRGGGVTRRTPLPLAGEVGLSGPGEGRALTLHLPPFPLPPSNFTLPQPPPGRSRVRPPPLRGGGDAQDTSPACGRGRALRPGRGSRTDSSPFPLQTSPFLHPPPGRSRVRPPPLARAVEVTRRTPLPRSGRGRALRPGRGVRIGSSTFPGALHPARFKTPPPLRAVRSPSGHISAGRVGCVHRGCRRLPGKEAGPSAAVRESPSGDDQGTRRRHQLR